MNRSRKRDGDSIEAEPNELLEKLEIALSLISSGNERLERLELMVVGLGGLIKSIAIREHRRDTRLMFNFDAMNARIASIRDIAGSVKAAYDGAIAQRDEARAERDALKADDTADAEKLAAAEASLAATEEMLKTLQAIAAGTPVVLPPDTGASTAGATAQD